MSHAVIVHLPLSDDNFGTPEERESIFLLENSVAAALEGAAVGEFDGNEFGGGECTLYMYGADADRMWNAVFPVLQQSRQVRGGYAIKRYGEAADPLAMETRVPL